VSETYTPPQRWRCEACRAAGDVGVPPSHYGVDGLDLAIEAHAAARPECAAVWGGKMVRLDYKAGQYSD